MMKNTFLAFSIFVTFLFIGCGTSNPLVATIGDEKITLHQFEDNYAKNNGGWDTCAASTLEDREKFLDLLIKFRLKVREARARGLDKDSSIVNELETYNITVGQTYQTEKEVVEPGIQQFYNRKKEEIRASHILFRLPTTANPEETSAVYERAMNVISQISTTPFETLAVRYSEDPTVKNNKGDLGYFTAGRMVPEFEDACYSMKVGEYTKVPVRTQFGYHIIKVTERQPNPGSVRISHILIRYSDDLSDTSAIRDTVWMIYNKIKSGESFEEMVKKYSQDKPSVSSGGDLGIYERSRLPKNVADLFYSMKVNEVSEPVQFNYGFHIFKLTEKKPVPPLKEIYEDVKKQYQQARFQYDNKKYIQALREKYKPVIDSNTVIKLISSIDTTKHAYSSEWKDTLSIEILKMPLIFSKGHKIIVNDFAEKIINGREYKNYVLSPSNVWLLAEKFLDIAATEEHAKYARERHPELKQILKEYEDGSLLFKIVQDEVWNKVMVNDSILKEYYEANKENYRWPDRVNLAEIHVLSDSVAKEVYWKLQYGEDFGEVAQEYTVRPGYKDKKGETGFQPYTLNELTRKASTMAVDSISEPFKYERGWSIIKTLAFDKARIKTFEEATPEVASAYQEFASKKREEEWLKELEKKYPVAINKEALKEAFKRKRGS